MVPANTHPPGPADDGRRFFQPVVDGIDDEVEDTAGEEDLSVLRVPRWVMMLAVFRRLVLRRRDVHPELPLDPDTDSASVAAAHRRLHTQPTHVLAVAIGGLAGTLTRYGLDRVLPASPGGWPTATFICNIVGALVLGLLLEALSRRGPDTGWRRRTRLLIGTGFCGALTTYSSFALEADLLARGHEIPVAIGYVVASVVVGLTATIAGIALATAHHQRAAVR